MRPATSKQDALYAEAKRIIETEGLYQGREPFGFDNIATVAVLVGASYLVARGGV